jgi:hypothetical protein
MKGRIALLASMAAAAALPAQAGYPELAREIEGYRPPALYRSVLTPANAPAPAPAAASHDDFEVQARTLRELKGRWEAALAEPTADNAFLVPDPERLARLKGAAADDAAAGAALADGFSLADLETLALLRNPAIASKARDLRAAIEGYSQAENLDTILRRYAGLAASLMTGVGPMDSPEAMSRTRFPFPGVLALKGQVVTQEATAARENLEAARRKAVTAVDRAYRELRYADAAVQTTRSMLDLLDDLKSSASARYAAGATSFQDVLKIGIEREKAKEELATLAGERKNAEAAIREALALPPSVRVGVPAVAEDGAPFALPPVETLQALALESRQELRAMRAMAGRMERMLLMQETMAYPGFTLDLSRYDRDEASRVGAGAMGAGRENFPSTTSSSVGEGLPKAPEYGTQETYLRELRQRLAGFEADIRAEGAATQLAVRNAWFAFDRAGRTRALYGDRVVTLSRSALEAANQGYSSGKVPFADLIEGYRGWFEANLALARSGADRGIALADLEDAVGRRLVPTEKR